MEDRYFGDFNQDEKRTRYGVDAYLGALTGLITAEREYETQDALLASLPPFNGVDVTERGEFTGGALPGTSFDELRDLVHSLLPR